MKIPRIRGIGILALLLVVGIPCFGDELSDLLDLQRRVGLNPAQQLRLNQLQQANRDRERQRIREQLQANIAQLRRNAMTSLQNVYTQAINTAFPTPTGWEPTVIANGVKRRQGDTAALADTAASYTFPEAVLPFLNRNAQTANGAARDLSNFVGYVMSSPTAMGVPQFTTPSNYVSPPLPGWYPGTVGRPVNIPNEAGLPKERTGYLSPKGGENGDIGNLRKAVELMFLNQSLTLSAAKTLTSSLPDKATGVFNLPVEKLAVRDGVPAHRGEPRNLEKTDIQVVQRVGAEAAETFAKLGKAQEAALRASEGILNKLRDDISREQRQAGRDMDGVGNGGNGNQGDDPGSNSNANTGNKAPAGGPSKNDSKGGEAAVQTASTTGVIVPPGSEGVQNFLPSNFSQSESIKGPQFAKNTPINVGKFSKASGFSPMSGGIGPTSNLAADNGLQLVGTGKPPGGLPAANSQFGDLGGPGSASNNGFAGGVNKGPGGVNNLGEVPDANPGFEKGDGPLKALNEVEFMAANGDMSEEPNDAKAPGAEEEALTSDARLALQLMAGLEDATGKKTVLGYMSYLRRQICQDFRKELVWICSHPMLKQLFAAVIKTVNKFMEPVQKVATRGPASVPPTPAQVTSSTGKSGPKKR